MTGTYINVIRPFRLITSLMNFSKTRHG